MTNYPGDNHEHRALLGLLALALVACGSISPVALNGNRVDGMAGTFLGGHDATAGATSDGSTSSMGAAGTGGGSDAAGTMEPQTDSGRLDACRWSATQTHVVIPCANPAHAECYYVDSFGTPDGRLDNCITEGKECVATCE